MKKIVLQLLFYFIIYLNLDSSFAHLQVKDESRNSATHAYMYLKGLNNELQKSTDKRINFDSNVIREPVLIRETRRLAVKHQSTERNLLESRYDLDVNDRISYQQKDRRLTDQKVSSDNRHRLYISTRNFDENFPEAIRIHSRNDAIDALSANKKLINDVAKSVNGRKSRVFERAQTQIFLINEKHSNRMRFENSRVTRFVSRIQAGRTRAASNDHKRVPSDIRRNSAATDTRRNEKSLVTRDRTDEISRDNINRVRLRQNVNTPKATEVFNKGNSVSRARHLELSRRIENTDRYSLLQRNARKMYLNSNSRLMRESFEEKPIFTRVNSLTTSVDRAQSRKQNNRIRESKDVYNERTRTHYRNERYVKARRVSLNPELQNKRDSIHYRKNNFRETIRLATLRRYMSTDRNVNDPTSEKRLFCHERSAHIRDANIAKQHATFSRSYTRERSTTRSLVNHMGLNKQSYGKDVEIMERNIRRDYPNILNRRLDSSVRKISLLFRRTITRFNKSRLINSVQETRQYRNAENWEEGNENTRTLRNIDGMSRRDIQRFNDDTIIRISKASASERRQEDSLHSSEKVNFRVLNRDQRRNALNNPRHVNRDYNILNKHSRNVYTFQQNRNQSILDRIEYSVNRHVKKTGLLDIVTLNKSKDENRVGYETIWKRHFETPLMANYSYQVLTIFIIFILSLYGIDDLNNTKVM